MKPRTFARWLKSMVMAAMLLPAAGLTSVTDSAPLLRVEAVTHTGPIRRLAVDPSDKLLVTVGDDSTARIWDLESRKLRSVLRIPIGDGPPGKLYGVAISPDGKDIAVGGTTLTGSGWWSHRIYLFKTDTGEAAGTIDARAGDVRDLAWSSDGRHLIAAYAGDDGVRVFDRSGTLVFEQRFSGPSYGLAVSPQGMVAVTAFDGNVHLYRLDDKGMSSAGKLALPLPDPISADFSPDGKLLAVGYMSRLGNGDVSVDVLQVDTGRVLKSFQFSDLPQGNLKNVRWSRSGDALYAAGSGYRGRADFIAKRIDWPSGRVSDASLGSDTVTAMAPLSNGRMVFSTFDGAWGILKDDLSVVRTTSPLHDLRGAALLRINPQATVVSWRSVEANTDVTFDLTRRLWLSKPPSDLRPARHSSFKFTTRDWENSFTPQLNGRAIALWPGEVSRATAVLPDNSAMLLATSWSLRKMDRAGKTLWTRPFSAEVRAVQVSENSKVIVIASSDGTLRWLSAADGSTLMSFLAVKDGRWILWTDDGRYDTSIGGEGLIGWHVNRPGDAVADFFPVSRFRDRFYHPAALDELLSTLSAGTSTPQAGLDLAPAAVTAPPMAQTLPPVVELLTPKELSTDRHHLPLKLRVRSAADAPVSNLSVHIDGQVVPYVEENRRQGEAREFTVPLPGRDVHVQVFAQNKHGTSEAAEMRVKWTGASPFVSGKPRLFVLAIGVSKYHDMPQLQFASKDAQDFAAAMQRQQGLFYREVETRLLVDQDASRANILDALNWLQEQVGPTDVGMLFLSGHGVTDKESDYVFLPIDADPSRLRDTGIGAAHIRPIAKLLGRSVIFIDSCHAGSVLGERQKWASGMTRLVNELGSAENSTVVFTASTGYQLSVEDDAWKNGAFTKALVEGLNGAADARKSGRITYKALDYYVSERVKQMTGGEQSPVTLSFGLPDFALASTR